jgi:hypothetical protein
MALVRRRSARLTEVERRLVDHVIRGEVLDLAGEPVDEAAMRAWDATHTIRASVLRDIMCGWLAPDPDPHGLQLRGAYIAGRLDLQNITSSVALELKDCLLDKGLVARDAHLPALVLVGCRIEDPSESPFDAVRCTTTALSLRGTTITGTCKAGAVNLRGAHIGQLQCDDARISNSCGPALDAEGLQTDQGVFSTGSRPSAVAEPARSGCMARTSAASCTGSTRAYAIHPVPPCTRTGCRPTTCTSVTSTPSVLARTAQSDSMAPASVDSSAMA